MTIRLRSMLMVCLTILPWAVAPPAWGAPVFFDSFEGRITGSDVAGTKPELGRQPWSVEGTGTLTTSADADGMALSVGTVFNTGYTPIGPAMGAERWIRLDLPPESTSGVVVTPQLQSGSEQNVLSLPAVWPTASGSDPWAVVNTTFTLGGGGSASPSQLNLAQLYPQCNRDIPFHLEIHWKVRNATPQKADMAIRIWNGDTPPAYAVGASTVYSLTAGTFQMNTRSALSKVGGSPLVSAVTMFDSVPEPPVIPASDDSFSYSGRWAAFGTEMHASGAGQRVRFLATGNSCTLLFRCDEASQLPISWRVDGGPWNRSTLPGGGNVELTIYSGQSWGPHTVEIIASAVAGAFWSNDNTRLVFRGIRIPAGGSVGPMPWPTHRVVFIGDSISCGYLVNGAVSGQPSNPVSDARLAPASLLADWLGWDTTNISIPGIGFLKPYSTNEGTPLVSQTFFDQKFQGIAWAPPSEVSAVVINLGTNDANIATYPDSQLRPAVGTYLQDIRARFPAATIYMMRPFNGAREATLKSALDGFADPNSKWVNTGASAPGGAWLDLTSGADTTDGLHPNAQGNEKVARRLITVLGADGAPASHLDWPADGATVSGRVIVRGSAHGADFEGAMLGYGEGTEPTAWRVIHQLQTPVSSSVLGIWDTRSLAPGSYALRLVSGAGNDTSTTTIHVNVVSEPWIGGPSPADAATVLKAAAGLRAPTSDATTRLDVYPAPGTLARLAGDGRLSIEDALVLLRP